MMDKINHWDTELLIFLNNLGTEFWDPFWIAITGTAIWIPFYALLVFLIFKKLEGKSRWLAILALIINVVITDQGSVQLFKEQFLRLRPCHVEEVLARIRLPMDRCGGQYGFISSHSSSTFGLAVLVGSLLKTHFRYIMSFMLIWAAFISYSRIYLGVHYPIDVLAGATFGCVSGYIVFRGHQLIVSRL